MPRKAVTKRINDGHDLIDPARLPSANGTLETNLEDETESDDFYKMRNYKKDSRIINRERTMDRNKNRVKLDQINTQLGFYRKNLSQDNIYDEKDSRFQSMDSSFANTTLDSRKGILDETTEKSMNLEKQQQKRRKYLKKNESREDNFDYRINQTQSMTATDKVQTLDNNRAFYNNGFVSDEKHNRSRHSSAERLELRQRMNFIHQDTTGLASGQSDFYNMNPNLNNSNNTRPRNTYSRQSVRTINSSRNQPSVSKPEKRYKVWPGNNRFYCCGNVVMAKQNQYFLLTLFLITSVSSLFWAFDCRLTLYELSGGIAIVVISGILFSAVMIFLFTTSFSDPGIIPRASKEEQNKIEQLLLEEENRLGNNTFIPSSHQPSPRLANINGHDIKLKFCVTCRIYRPPRTSHCSICNNCVQRFDHHCPWVGNCVGARNYRFFYFFLTSLSFFIVYIFSFSIVNLVVLTNKNKQTFWKSMQQSPSSVINLVICFFSMWSVLGLAFFHSILSCKDRTTHEDIKGTPLARNYTDNSVTPIRSNPYSHGSFFKNLMYVLFSKRNPSLIDSQAWVDPAFPMENKPAYPENVKKYTDPDRVFKETIAYRYLAQKASQNTVHAETAIDLPHDNNNNNKINTQYGVLHANKSPSISLKNEGRGKLGQKGSLGESNYAYNESLDTMMQTQV